VLVAARYKWDQFEVDARYLTPEVFSLPPWAQLSLNG
jgi:hypothetical protein